MPLSDAAAHMRDALQSATQGFVERETLMEIIVLAAVAGEHVLVVGPPGTAKSAAVRRLTPLLGGNYFEYLLGRFTEPTEIFGAVDLLALREGRVQTDVTGMLPEANVAFLDEVFLGSTAILNTLLGVLNERRFRRGHTDVACPLRVCVGASNALPDDPALEAFADRFLLQVHLERVEDPRLEELLEVGASANGMANEALDPAILDSLSAAAAQCDLSRARPWIADAVRTLRRAGIQLSDRRIVKSQSLIAAAAALAGRTAAEPQDLWAIVFAIPGTIAQQEGRDALAQLLLASANETLPSAAETASRGIEARADRLVAEARARLAELAADGTAPEGNGDRLALQLEGLLREIDAGFSSDSLPGSLVALRIELAQALEQFPLAEESPPA